MRGKNNRERQFFNNLDNILGGYENGRFDFGEEQYPNLTAGEWIDYVMTDMYNQRSNGCGYTVYGDMIAGDLRFLGNKWMHEQIINEVRNEGWLIKEED